MFRPHTFGGVTEVCMAYETLRDPIRRRAYDASLGLPADPLRPAPMAEPKLRPGPFVHPALGSLRQQPIHPNGSDRPTDPMPKMDLPHRPLTDVKPRPGPQLDGHRPQQVVLEEHFAVEASPIEWKHVGMAVGALAMGACLLGALAGWWLASDVGEPEQSASAVSASLPPTKPQATTAPPLRVPDPSLAEIWPGSPRRAAPEPFKRMRPVPQRAAAVEQRQERQLQEGEPQQIEPDSSAGDLAAAVTPVASTTAVAMPLPNKVVARTIDRIGYACGAVASADPVEGEVPGVYKVTCTSGQSFQAKPVNGRYRFRRLGRN